MKGRIVIKVNSPIQADMVFSMLMSKTFKETNKSLEGKKSKLDKDIQEGIRKGKITLDSDVDKRELIFNLEGTSEEVEHWIKMSLKERFIARGMKKFIEIRTEKIE